MSLAVGIILIILKQLSVQTVHTQAFTIFMRETFQQFVAKYLLGFCFPCFCLSMHWWH